MHTNGKQSATGPRRIRPDDGPTGRPDERPVEWITVKGAADALGITVEAVRGRIKRGTLPHRKDADGSVRVLVGDRTGDRTDQDTTGPRDQTGDQSRPDAADPDGWAERDELVAVLREQLDAEREARKRADAIIMQLSQANAALAARVPELPAADDKDATPDARDGHETAPDGAGGGMGHRDDQAAQNGARDGAQRSWWQRLFFG